MIYNLEFYDEVQTDNLAIFNSDYSTNEEREDAKECILILCMMRASDILSSIKLIQDEDDTFCYLQYFIKNPVSDNKEERYTIGSKLLELQIKKWAQPLAALINNNEFTNDLLDKVKQFDNPQMLVNGIEFFEEVLNRSLFLD